MIIPTGIGAAIGGYAGDALPVARAVAQVCDRVITHPNVLNGASLYWPIDNALYVEGYALDQFAEGNWGLEPVRANRIGVIFDRGIETELRLRHLQVMDGARATLGLHCHDYGITDEELGVELKTAPSGASWGTIARPDSLLRAAEKLITPGQVDAIAVVARFPDDIDPEQLQNYRQGIGVDPLAGAEAIISHLVVRQFAVPCAHAPALSPLPVDSSISPRSAAEELGYTFLSCVLVGLSRAPRYCHQPTPTSITHTQVNAVIIPASACGGSAILSFSGQPHTKIITVGNNSTALDVTAESLNLNVIPVANYHEAIGWLVCDRAGINGEAFHPEVKGI